MTFLAQLIAICTILYLIKILLYPFFRPSSKKQKVMMRQYQKEKKKEKNRERFYNFKIRIIKQYGKYLMTSTERIKLSKLLNRLDISKWPEEIRLTQIMYVLCAVLIMFLAFKVDDMFGYGSGVLIILAWLAPIDELEKKVEQRNTQISLDFPAFYSMVYYQYSKTVNIYLSDVIKDYLPNANREMADELGVVLDNIELNGEEYALKQFKKRVPLHYIIKFCDVMEARLRGYDNVSQLLYLKNEVDTFRLTSLEKELDKRKASNERLQMILIVVLCLYVVIYFVFNTLSAIELFQ